MSDGGTPVVGRNGVAVPVGTQEQQGKDGFRSYEVHQRQRIGESTEKIRPGSLNSDAYRTDPYPLLAILREHYPCYRDWQANAYWLTRYDAVTSVFTDEANFERRAKRWYYGLNLPGRNLNDELPVLTAEANCYDRQLEAVVEGLLNPIGQAGSGDLVHDFTARLPLGLLVSLVGVPDDRAEEFCALYWRAQRGTSWQPELQEAGRAALVGLAELIEPLLARREPGNEEDLLSACLEVDPAATAWDVVVTLLERDHETLHGSLSNLWYLLLTHPDALAGIGNDGRLMKQAYLEALRHSPPVLSARTFTRHEVERFGRLLPEGALVICSAAAANRDPRVFADPDRFIPGRADLTQREPRGQYRADGLASGIAFGCGRPSRFPAVPEDRPRSRYALNRDVAVRASMLLLAACEDLALAPGAEPSLTALSLGEMHTCWSLPVTCRPGPAPQAEASQR